MAFTGISTMRRFLGSLALLVATGCLLSVSHPVAAQLDTQTAIVLDFDVVPGEDSILGRKASDALAVELQRQNQFEEITSQQVEIIPRQRLVEIIDDQAGLIAPYTEVVQSRLGQAAKASRVYSGSVLSVLVSDQRMARVTVEVRVLDVPTRTYFNGAIASQEAVSIGGPMDNDLLIDQAINKAVYAALMEIKSKPLPLATVQNVTSSELYLNVGTRNGVLKGQRYVIIRPLYRGRDSESLEVVQSVRVAEVIILQADMDQSIAAVISGGGAGVKTGDKAHLVYIPAVIPMKNPDLKRTKDRYLTPDELQAKSALEESRRRQLEEEKKREQLEKAEKKAREAQKKAKRKR